MGRKVKPARKDVRVGDRVIVTIFGAGIARRRLYSGKLWISLANVPDDPKFAVMMTGADYLPPNDRQREAEIIIDPIHARPL